jgi:asparagine synthase (glutamine-hydrolysing)
LIYTKTNDNFIFSSELKPILNSGLINKKLNYVALGDYFRYGSVKQPYTIIDNVYQLMPGHTMVVDFDKNIHIEKYYDLVESSNTYPIINDYKEACIETRAQLEAATRYHMVSDVEVGVFLSGGVDSTAVTALMNRFSSSRLKTFSVGWSNQSEVFNEVDIASRTANQLGTEHHNIIIDDNYITDCFDEFIDQIDQPSIDGLNTFIVSKETAKEVKVAISGLGGDEVFAGYPHFETIRRIVESEANLITFTKKLLFNIFPSKFQKYKKFNGNYSYEELVDLGRSISKNIYSSINFSFISKENNYIDKHNLSAFQRISLHEFENYLLNTLLRDADVMSMAHSLEVRPILLDHKLVEFAFGIQDSFKVRNGIMKSVLIDSVKDLIPSEVWNRQKTGFAMPFKKWLNSTLNTTFLEELNSFNGRSIFNENYFASLLFAAKNKQLESSNWKEFILITWLNRNGIEF